MGFAKRPLARKLLYSILLISTIVTTLLTTLSFYLDYSAEMDLIEQRMLAIQTESVPTISGSLWEFNEALLNVEAQSLLLSSDITGVSIFDSDGDTIINKQKEFEYSQEFGEQRQFDLMHNNGAELVKVGLLKISISKLSVYQKILTRASIFFLTQGVKTFLVSFLILMVVNQLVTRHLEAIAQGFSGNEDKWGRGFTPISLKRKVYIRDELDTLVEVLNKSASHLDERISQQNVEISEAAKRLEEQESCVRQSQRLAGLGEVAGSIGHEINNPVSIITGSVQLIQRHMQKETRDQSLIDKNLDRIEKTADRMRAIVRGLLALSREGEADPKLYFNFSSIVESVHALCKHKAANAGVELIFENLCGGSDEKLFAQEGPLSQVMVNLVSNSIDAIEGFASSEPKWVKIELSSNKEFQIVRVIDSGHGIPDEIAEKIFQAFYTTKPIGKGTGLGLGICQKIVGDQGGTLELVKSTEHTTFELKLPRAPAQSIEQESMLDHQEKRAV